MRDFQIITGYELRQQLGKRSVRVTTLILMLAALILTGLPRISQMLRGEKQPGAAAYTEQADGYMADGTGYVFMDEAQRAEYTALLSLSDGNVYESREALVAALKSRSIDRGFVLGADGFEAVYQDKGMEDERARNLAAVMAASHREKMLAEKGLTAEEFAAIEHYEPAVSETVMGKSSENNFLISMALMLAVYILVLLYGSTTSVIIAREKDSKAMELLITSTKPAPLILGKVAAAGISGVVQFGLIALAALAGFLFARDYYSPGLIAMLQGSLSQSYVLTYIFFSLTGYLLYLFLYAALGSTVSKVEDVSSATALVQFIFIAGYVASSFVMNDPAGTLAVVTSLIPFTAVMVMPMRAGLMTVPAAQLLVAGALMLASLCLFAWLSIKIYRWGSLNYGNKLSLKKLLREALRAWK